MPVAITMSTSVFSSAILRTASAALLAPNASMSGCEMPDTQSTTISSRLAPAASASAQPTSSPLRYVAVLVADSASRTAPPRSAKVVV